MARGEYVILLNNDAVVCEGWLDQLAALAESDPAIGVCGPMSNKASPPQLAESVPYRDLDALPGFAAGWRARHRGGWLEAAKLSGFCLMIKRAVLESVGGWASGSGRVSSTKTIWRCAQESKVVAPALHLDGCWRKIKPVIFRQGRADRRAGDRRFGSSSARRRTEHG